MAGARLGYLVADPAVVLACEAVVLPYHLSAQTQLAGLLALQYTAEMEARVARIAEERGRVAAALGDLPVDSWPSDANFILFRPAAPRRGQGVARAARALGAHPQLRQLGRAARLPAGHHRAAGRERPIPDTPWRRACDAPTPAVPPGTRATKETTIEAALALDGTGSSTSRPGCPFFDHMVEQLGRHACST